MVKKQNICYCHCIVNIYLTRYAHAYVHNERYASAVLDLVIKGMDTLSREKTLLKWLCIPSEKGSSLKQKDLLPGEQIISF